jgi:hypothetical protein
VEPSDGAPDSAAIAAGGSLTTPPTPGGWPGVAVLVGVGVKVLVGVGVKVLVGVGVKVLVGVGVNVGVGVGVGVGGMQL